MFSGPTLPPQAYTREILTSAFNWLQNQPESVKKLATTPDALVGLFMRAQRYGNSSLESDAPVSSQNFMSDLKNLAEGLKQFEEPKRSRTMNHNMAQMAATTSTTTSTTTSSTTTSATLAAEASAAAQGPGHIPLHLHHQVVPPHPVAPPAVLPAQTTISGTINENADRMIQEVKKGLNLSSDAEAINMMVSIAYKTLKDLIG